MNSSKNMIELGTDCYNTPSTPRCDDEDGGGTAGAIDNNSNQPPLVRRYLCTDTDGEFHSAIVYTETETPSGYSILRGGYYGYEGGCAYDGGYFFVNTETGDSQLLDYDEAECGPESELYGPAMELCVRFWRYPDEPDSPDSAEASDEWYWLQPRFPEWSEEGLALLKEGRRLSDGRVVFADEEFDGDLLDEVSLHWALTLHFCSTAVKYPWLVATEDSRMSG